MQVPGTFFSGIASRKARSSSASAAAGWSPPTRWASAKVMLFPGPGFGVATRVKGAPPKGSSRSACTDPGSRPCVMGNPKDRERSP